MNSQHELNNNIHIDGWLLASAVFIVGWEHFRLGEDILNERQVSKWLDMKREQA
jgi:hypothetical protein